MSEEKGPIEIVIHEDRALELTGKELLMILGAALLLSLAAYALIVESFVAAGIKP